MGLRWMLVGVAFAATVTLGAGAMRWALRARRRWAIWLAIAVLAGPPTLLTGVAFLLFEPSRPLTAPHWWRELHFQRPTLVRLTTAAVVGWLLGVLLFSWLPRRRAGGDDLASRLRGERRLFGLGAALVGVAAVLIGVIDWRTRATMRALAELPDPKAVLETMSEEEWQAGVRSERDNAAWIYLLAGASADLKERPNPRDLPLRQASAGLREFRERCRAELEQIETASQLPRAKFLRKRTLDGEFASGSSPLAPVLAMVVIAARCDSQDSAEGATHWLELLRRVELQLHADDSVEGARDELLVASTELAILEWLASARPADPSWLAAATVEAPSPTADQRVARFERELPWGQRRLVRHLSATNSFAAALYRRVFVGGEALEDVPVVAELVKGALLAGESGADIRWRLFAEGYGMETLNVFADALGAEAAMSHCETRHRLGAAGLAALAHHQQLGRYAVTLDELDLAVGIADDLRLLSWDAGSVICEDSSWPDKHTCFCLGGAYEVLRVEDREAAWSAVQDWRGTPAGSPREQESAQRLIELLSR